MVARMQKTLAMCGLLAAMAVATGCSTPSLQGLCSADKTVDDRGLDGVWSDGDTVAVVQRSGPGEYAVATLIDAGGTPTALKFDACLVELGGKRFVDMAQSADGLSELSETYAGFAVPTHQFAQVERKGDRLVVRTPADGQLTGGSKASLPHVMFPDRSTVVHGKPSTRPIITAPTSALQRFFTDHGGDPTLYDQAFVLQRAPQP